MIDPALSIREAKVTDVAPLQQFLRPFVAAKHILPRSDEDLAVLIRHGFVAVREAEIVGFAAIEIYSRKLAEVQSLAVATEWQRQGLGLALVQHCVDRATSEGVLELMAITASENLFRSAGFDYSLPNQKRALFIQTRETDPHE